MSRSSSRPLSPIEVGQESATEELEEEKQVAIDGHEDDIFGDEDLEESEEAVRVGKGAKRTYVPSTQEILVHNRSHTPFRTWCKHCVAARGPNLAHKRPEPDRGAARNQISADYCFLRDVQGGPSQVVLGGRDRRTGVYFSHAVPYKGAGQEWISQQLVRDILKCGYHGRVLLKGDQEHALQDLFADVAKRRGELPTNIECSPVGESQANGFAERAIRSIEEMVRTHKLALESRLGQGLPIEHPVVAWLIEHAADILNKTQVGRDGRTPYERLKGRKYAGVFLEFGAQVMLKVSGKLQGGLMQERWVDGTWLGMRWSSQEHLVARACDGVVVRTRAVREVPRAVTLDILDGIVGMPHAPQGVAKFEKLEVPRMNQVPEPPLEDPMADLPRPIPRNIYVTKEMLRRFGYTEDCPKCTMLRRGLPHGPMNHSVECRKLMIERMKADPDYQERVEAAESRKNAYLAEELERENRKRKPDKENSEEDAKPRGPGAQPSVSSSSGLGPQARGVNQGVSAPDSVNRGGEKRKATEELEGEESRTSDDRSDEIPVPDASPDVVAFADRPDTEMESSLGSGTKRPHEDSDQNMAKDAEEITQDTRRARLEQLCSVLHGDQTLADDLAGSTRDISLLKSAIDQEPVLMHLNSMEPDNQGDFSQYEDEWVPWWMRKSHEEIPKEFTAEQVLEAKRTELAKFAERGVYKVVDRSEMEQDARLLSAKWVVTNKGSITHPRAKARLVAREFVSGAIDRDTLFAGTPALPMARTLISRAASTRTGRRKRKIMLMDVTAAFLYGLAERNLYIEIPVEDPASLDGSKVAKLIRSLYGTRDAPQLWSKHVGQTLRSLGYMETVGMPGMYYHPERDVQIALHVDDFLVVGEEEDLIELRDALKQHYEMKATILGPDEGDAKQGEFLGRTIRYQDWGIELEGGNKHVHALLKSAGMESCRTVNTPMLAEDYKNDPKRLQVDEKKALNNHDTKLFRRGAALTVYMAQDRPDICASACNLAGGMQQPTEKDWEKLKRTCRYLKGAPRCKLEYGWQDEGESGLKIQTDADWANEVVSRKSHSGGVIQLGTHLLHHWCRRQPVIALSSGEAELYSAVCGLTRAIGILNVGREMFGKEWANLVTHEVDAAACKSMLMRKGSGGVKHLDVKVLWVQEAILQKGILIKKIPRDINAADSLACFSNAKTLKRHLGLLRCVLLDSAGTRLP